MANIEALRKDVPLYEVVEHILGDRGQQTDAMPEEWDDLAFDETVVKAMDSALADLIRSIKDGLLKVNGRREGNWDRESVPSGLFVNIAGINPLADIDIDIEDSGKAKGGGIKQENGKAVLDFNEDGFGIISINKGLCVRSEVTWNDITADSGEEVLALWPAPNLEQRLREAIARKGAPLTQREAEVIASDAGVEGGQKKSREVLKYIQGKGKQGPRGPRNAAK
jgi:hypothetical protein